MVTPYATDQGAGIYSDDSFCDKPCSYAYYGNENCGGNSYLSLYVREIIPQTTVPGGYQYIGCYIDDSSSRTLSAKSTSDNYAMTLETCASFCQGYGYFGIESGM